MMMLVHDVGCSVKSLTRPLTFLLINLGTASEIYLLSYLQILSISCDSWNLLEYSIACDVLRRSAADMPF